MKFLVYIESPSLSTGQGNVAKHLLQFMTEFGYELEVCAWNHFDQQKYPYTIHTSDANDPFSIRKMKDLIMNGEYDAIFINADIGPINEFEEEITYEAKRRRNVPVIVYTCVDGDVLPSSPIARLHIIDQVVAFCEHSRGIMQKYVPTLDMNVIYHGCEPDVFYPLSPEQRREVRKNTFGIDDDTFIVLNVNRNQWRKDLGRTMMIFHEFHKQHPKSKLCIHAKQLDLGGCLPMMAECIGMTQDEVGFPPSSFRVQEGLPRKALNLLYNAADVFMSTTTGEGFGLTTTEAMSAGLPVIMPRNTSNIEFLGEDEARGYLADSGGDIDHISIPYGYNNSPRPIVHARSMLEKLEHVYQHRDRAKAKAVVAREWTEAHTWEHVKEQWRALFRCLSM
jgi:glycosyltransferase involved in cell wall biosynthesis